jgi:Ni/Co efflux regulator RcnB
MTSIPKIALILSLLSSSVAFADGQDKDHDKDRGKDHGDNHGNKRPDNGSDRWADRQPDNRPDRDNRYTPVRPQANPHDNDVRYSHMRPRPQVRQVPQRYRQDRYVVQDWRQRDLREPPRGYHWVRDDSNQYLLAAIVGGFIAEVAMQDSHRYDRQWVRGQRLIPEYRSTRYRVQDWYAYDLPRPRAGRRWVRTDSQYILISVQTGIIYRTAPRRR